MVKIIKDRITYECNKLKFRLILFLMKNLKFISPKTQYRVGKDFFYFLMDADPYFIKTTGGFVFKDSSKVLNKTPLD